MTAVDRVGVVWRRPEWRDALAAAVLLVLVEVPSLLQGEPTTGGAWVSLTLGAIAVVPLAWRRRAPVVVWLVSGCATLAALANHGSPGVIAVAPCVALYTVATTSPRRVSLRVAGGTLAGVVLGAVAGATRTANEQLGPTAVVFPVAVVAAAWLIGDNRRVRRAYVAELEAKAARAEAERAADATRAAASERARIARELHDIVVHHVSVIAVQAGAARMLAEQRGGDTDSIKALSAMEAGARQALGELRQLLGVLRSDGESPVLAPPPGLAQLDRLLDDVRQAGLPVEARVEGTAVPLPAALDLSAYRIVQEALTNVMKHQGPVATTVVVRYGTHDLEVEVADRGARRRDRAGANDSGHGLIGMRERVTLLGGRLDAGPRPGGGFAVVAHLPIGDPSQ